MQPFFINMNLVMVIKSIKSNQNSKDVTNALPFYPRAATWIGPIANAQLASRRKLGLVNSEFGMGLV